MKLLRGARRTMAATALAAALAAAPKSSASAPTTPFGPPSIILLSLDTLRADRLGCYGNPRGLTPELDRLARRGRSCARVVAETSWTLPSHMTILTGLPPTSHGVTLESHRLADGIPTIAQALRERGYRTAAVTDGGLMERRFGFDRGFDTYDDIRKELELTLYRGRRFLQGLAEGERCFLFLHSYAVHCPYTPAEIYHARFAARPAADRIDPENKCADEWNRLRLTDGQVAYVSDLYDAGVRAADDAVRRFVHELEAEHRFANTVLVVLSDHGEELMEHGRIGHERTLHGESLLVPLVLAGAGVPAALETRPVGLVDVTPTLLHLAGAGLAGLPGRSLLEGAAPEAARFGELDRDVTLRSMTTDDTHVIVDVARGGLQVYDLASDPAERHDLGSGAPRARALEKSVRDHFDALPRPEQVTSRPPTLQELEELRALGYVD